VVPSTTSALLYSYGRATAIQHLSVWVVIVAVVLLAALLQLVRLAERRL
jgi:hypothetical protein